MEDFLGIEVNNVPAMKTNLIFQYKKPEFITVSTGKEWHHWHAPYYRYDVYQDQQRLLMHIHTVFGTRVLAVYASPALHVVSELVQAHIDKKVMAKSNFRRVSDLNTHHRNTYTREGTYSVCCSNPEQIENFDVVTEIDSLDLNKQRDEDNRSFIINFRKQLVVVVSQDATIGNALVQLNSTYQEFEKFELLYSFLVLNNLRTITGIQWLITF